MNKTVPQLNVLSKERSFGEWYAQLDAIGGQILVDKPEGWTSYDVIRALQPLFPSYKVGHTGTLDPLATGLLILCVGRATRLVPFFQELPKEYRTTIKLGAVTETDDREGEEQFRCTVPSIDREQLQRVLQKFIGTIWQVPPRYSAIKKRGQRSYKQARQGKSVALEPRLVEIFSIEILALSLPFVELYVRCGKGVYIRSLARDIGEALGTGGYVYALRRTAIGPFSVSSALKPAEIQTQAQESVAKQ